MQQAVKLLLFTLLACICAAQNPQLSYSSYFGGDGSDVITSVASDKMGNSYICGFTYSSNLPVTAGAFQSKHGGVPGTLFSFATPPPLPDAFVAKFSASGSLIYATYLGGKDYDTALSIAVDSSGSAIVAGLTSSANFPVTAGAFKTSLPSGGQSTIFIAKLNATGSALDFATYFGGSGDSVRSVALDAAGNIYFTGEAHSADFPITAGALGQGASGGVFAAKLSADGSSLLFSSILGGISNDAGTAIAVGAAGNAYLTGYTSSTNFPVTAGAFQTHSSADLTVFVAKVNADASAFLYSTLLGGSSANTPGGRIVVNAAGEVSLTGWTQATDFPVTELAFQKTLAGVQNAFLTKFNPTLSALVFSTYFGGTQAEYGEGLVEDVSGNLWVAGSTNSTDFPITTPELTRAFAGSPCLFRGATPFGNPPLSGSCLDTFTAKFDPAGNLLYSSTLSGSNLEMTSDLTVDPSSVVTVVGSTRSDDFPVTIDAFQSKRFPATCTHSASPSSFDTQPCEDGFMARVGGTPVSVPSVPFVIVNRAGYLPSAIAPNEIVSLFGPGIGPDAAAGPTIDRPGSVSRELGGFRLLFDGMPAPLLYLSRHQINAIVPNIVVKDSVTVAIEHNGSVVASTTVHAAAFSPGIPLQGDGLRGQAALVNEDGTLNSPSHPAKPFSIATLYVFGVNPSGKAGQIADSATPLTDVPIVVVGNNVPDIKYAGPSPGQVSALTQINFVVPELFKATQEVYVVIGNVSSPFGALITIQ